MFFKIFTENQDYGDILQLQENLRKRVLNGELEEGVVLFLCHNPVYTYGIRGDEKNLLADGEFLSREGISQFRIRRGGDVTYHGPGQLVVYPILNIKMLGFSSIKSFVEWWSELFVDLLKECYGISASFDEERPGVWGEKGKIVAAGLHFRKFVPIHGFAVNLDPEMKHFAGIVPCGLKGYQVSSVRLESGATPEVKEVALNVVSFLKRRLEAVELKKMEDL